MNTPIITTYLKFPRDFLKNRLKNLIYVSNSSIIRRNKADTFKRRLYRKCCFASHKEEMKKTSCNLESQLPYFARDYSISFRIASQLLDYVRSRLARPSQCSRIVLLGFDSRPCPVGIEIQQSLVIDLLTWCLAELSLGLSHTGHSRRQIVDVALESGARCNEDAHYCTLKTHNRPQPRQREHFSTGVVECIEYRKSREKSTILARYYATG